MDDKSVYVVSHGEYSDWKIVGVFTTLEKAEEFRKVYPDCNENIEEHTLDPETPEWMKNGLRPFCVRMSKDGQSEAGKIRNIDDFDGEKFELHNALFDRSNKKYDPFYYHEIYLRCVVLARDREHAVKIANEKRVQMIASGEWDAFVEEINNARKRNFVGWRCK